MEFGWDLIWICMGFGWELDEIWMGTGPMLMKYSSTSPMLVKYSSTGPMLVKYSSTGPRLVKYICTGPMLVNYSSTGLAHAGPPSRNSRSMRSCSGTVSCGAIVNNGSVQFGIFRGEGLATVT